ncbi:MAG TPA: sulfite exporter TauE/SafE family protein [Nocardioidaceae bacterium]|nr:sulfite exporter TauE/SafE family protein [Nocardioidaceae bacterium]
MPALMVLAVAGLMAQLVDGSLGMGFGVTSSTLLVAAGIAPATASASIHLAEVGTTLVSGLSHHKLGNVDWRTVAVMAVPGGIGAFAGAHFLAGLPAEVAKPWVAGLLFLLGVYVIWRFLVLGGRRPQFEGRVSTKLLLPMGLFGGALDAVGGGGWGPVGTTSLLASGRLAPRMVVGSVSAAEFVVAVGGSVGFLMALGKEGVDAGFVVALLAGGVVAAPLAAWLVKRLAARVLGVAAGGLILLTNSKTVMESLGAPGLYVALAAAALAMLWMSLIAVAVRQERAARPLEAVPG